MRWWRLWRLLSCLADPLAHDDPLFPHPPRHKSKGIWKRAAWLLATLIASSVLSSSLVAGQIRDGEGNELPRKGDEDLGPAGVAGVYHDQNDGAGQGEGDALSEAERLYKIAQDVRYAAIRPA